VNSRTARILPPDQGERERALDAGRSILVQAPAGSGKTDLLTRRFLRLLGEVEEPGQIVAITFTRAAAAEMRHRILSELEKAESGERREAGADEFLMEALAQRALERSRALGWNLIDLPAQLRISTIDSFCRDLALQQPLLSGLGGGLEIAEQPTELYLRAARRSLEEIDTANPALREAIEELLLWRDNNWQEMEGLLVGMLADRDRWMQSFLLEREPDWEALRERLERPFAATSLKKLTEVSRLLDQVPEAREEALALARFACEQCGGVLFQENAEIAEFPTAPFTGAEALEEARQASVGLAELLLTSEGAFRKQVDKRLGFPTDRKIEKSQILNLIARLDAVPGLESSLAAVRNLPSSRYTEEEWRIVRASFTLLRHAAGQLEVVFAEAGALDFTEVAQAALKVLHGDDGFPTDSAQAVADRIRHLLVDEFQDTSRRQHQLLARLIAAWPEREGRTGFVVGDPMQSIYFFRDADAELFPRVEQIGLEIPHDLPLRFDPVRLKANFRSAAPLVDKLNEVFQQIFAANDGSGVSFSAAEPAPNGATQTAPDVAADGGSRLELHLEFMPQTNRSTSADPDAVRKKEEVTERREAARMAQTQEIVNLIRGHRDEMEQCRLARERGEDKKYRVAVLGRTRSALAPVAEALREAGIPFRAVELEGLRERPEVLDGLALGRALLNPQDRVAWLGVLRAPWCGLSLEDLHALVSADDRELLARPVPELLGERLGLLSREGRIAAERVLRWWETAPRLRADRPASSLGTWLEQAWLGLGGAECVDATARANLDLLWRSLDGLPEGEQDLLGPALDAALDKLTALPDPAAGSECGVQLMTIHKSKGLEFEVVIVPDLQAGTGHGQRKLLSWLERGLAQPESSGEITEFLVAPLQLKGDGRGKAQEWVDRVYRERESQEARRILYVAATRAREEVHFFARPAFKTEKDGSRSLREPKNCLLATAWPALGEEIQQRFEEWNSRAADRELAYGTVEAIAATGEENLLVMQPPVRPTLLRRLPVDGWPAQEDGLLSARRESALAEAMPGAAGPAIESWGGALYTRHEGGLLSRALGSAVHALLEELSRLRTTRDWEQARAALRRMEPRIGAQIRAVGLGASEAHSMAAKALEIVLKASSDPIGEWILSDHAEAASEARWTGAIAGNLRTVQVDRVFRAGPGPRAPGDDVWWIIDYKTAHEDGLNPAEALPEFRRLFSAQVESYAQMLRDLKGSNATVRAGLYYPRMMQFDWWEL
jgi:ATP-dependent exoDNAse (exonuclease V) beta subunit